MNLELFQAIFTIRDFCLSQNNCSNCQLKELCQKMPCEWEVRPARVRVEISTRSTHGKILLEWKKLNTNAELTPRDAF
jgi:hypothetical protein